MKHVYMIFLERFERSGFLRWWRPVDAQALQRTSHL